jgi:predicted component of type VI protein secretion system
MQRVPGSLALMLLCLLVAGCSSTPKEETPTTTAPINNNAPEAKTAPGAGPPNPEMGAPGPPKKGGP